LLEQGRNDPSKRSKPEVYDATCYICRDHEFELMGLPLCKACPRCSASADGEKHGHVPADDEECSICGFNLHVWYDEGQPADLNRGQEKK